MNPPLFENKYEETIISFHFYTSLVQCKEVNSKPTRFFESYCICDATETTFFDRSIIFFRKFSAYRMWLSLENLDHLVCETRASQ